MHARTHSLVCPRPCDVSALGFDALVDMNTIGSSRKEKDHKLLEHEGNDPPDSTSCPISSSSSSLNRTQTSRLQPQSSLSSSKKRRNISIRMNGNDDDDDNNDNNYDDNDDDNNNNNKKNSDNTGNGFDKQYLKEEQQKEVDGEVAMQTVTPMEGRISDRMNCESEGRGAKMKKAVSFKSLSATSSSTSLPASASVLTTRGDDLNASVHPSTGFPMVISA